MTTTSNNPMHLARTCYHDTQCGSLTADPRCCSYSLSILTWPVVAAPASAADGGSGRFIGLGR